MFKVNLRRTMEERRRTKRFFCFLVGLIFYLLSSLVPLPSSLVHAAVPHLINYQGRLTDSSGNPLNGSYSLTFRIYDAESAGNLLWEETHSGALIQKGIFSILLGSVTALNLPFDKQYFLEIKVGNEVMSPRQRISSSAYAIRAEKAEGVSGITNFFPASGNVGIGIANPTDKLDINGAIAINSKRVIDSSGNWVGSSTNLVGPTGAQGSQGPQGPTGSQGLQGPPGPAVHTSAICGATVNLCTMVCTSYDKVVAASYGICVATADTGSCRNDNLLSGGCCVCKP